MKRPKLKIVTTCRY